VGPRDGLGAVAKRTFLNPGRQTRSLVSIPTEGWGSKVAAGAVIDSNTMT